MASQGDTGAGPGTHKDHTPPPTTGVFRQVGEAIAAFSKAQRKLVGVNNIMKESFFVDRFTELCTFTLPPSADAVDVHSAVSFAKEVVVTTTSRVSCENIGRYLPNKGYTIQYVYKMCDVTREPLRSSAMASLASPCASA